MGPDCTLTNWSSLRSTMGAAERKRSTPKVAATPKPNARIGNEIFRKKERVPTAFTGSSGYLVSAIHDKTLRAKNL
jgi:hypothetical protein